MNDNERLDLYTSTVPNERQLKIQQMPFYAFVHYGLNTFTNHEWGKGYDSPDVFNPKDQNTDEWCKAIKSAGMKGVVLTCKRLNEMGAWLKKEDECVIGSNFTSNESNTKYKITFEKQSVDRLRLSEDTTKSQRVEEFEIIANGKCVFKGIVIGFSKIAIFNEPIVCDSVTLSVLKSRKQPYINKIEVCKTGAYRL